MPWFTVDDGFADHPKVIRCSLAAIGLWTKAGSWCAKHLTDGAVPGAMLRVWGGTPRHAAELVEAGLWLRAGGGYQFHQWSPRNPTKLEVEAKRAKDAARKREERAADSRESPSGHPRGQPSDSAEDSGVTPIRVQDPSRAGARGRVPSHPLPSPPIPEDAEAEAPLRDAATALPVSTGEVERAWHEPIRRLGHTHLHAEHAWRIDFGTIAEAIEALPAARKREALTAVCEWFWTAPDGPIVGKRVGVGKASPRHLARNISSDLEAAYAWWRAEPRAAQ